MGQQVQIYLQDPRLSHEGVEIEATLDPPMQATGHVDLVVVDSDGSEVLREKMEVEFGGGQLQGVWMLIPGDQLQNGDHVAWVRAVVHADTAGTVEYSESEYKGVSCIVHDGHVYGSTEAPAPLPQDTQAIALENARLEGDWAVCDIVNSSTHDVQCNYKTAVSSQQTDPVEQHAEELVRGNARQQIHSMLPRDLPDGDYWISFEARVAGDISDYGGVNAGIHIDVNNGVVTVIP